MQYQFDVTVAERYSLEEAVFVHRIYHWVMHNAANERNFADGQYWTHDSAQALAKLFPFWTARQIQRIVQKCREHGLILTRQLSNNPTDRTLWYTVTETVKSIYANGEMDLTVWCNGFHQTGECIKGTNKRPNKRQRETRAETEEKTAYGEFGNVYLTHAEYDKLHTRWTEAQVAQEIENLSAYMASKRKRYESHYATLPNWLKKDFPPQSKTTLIEEDWVHG